MASIPNTKAGGPLGANDNHIGAVEHASSLGFMLPPVTLDAAQLARPLTEEEHRIRRVTTALRGKLAQLAASRRLRHDRREPDG